MHRTPVLICVLLLSLVSVNCDDEAAAEVHHEWHRGFIGKFAITPETAIEDGWKLIVTFTAPIKK